MALEIASDDDGGGRSVILIMRHIQKFSVKDV